jgi:hypothetical protein
MTKPSWQDFGTHDESIVPELWDGVVGAWAPCLGPTGSRLHDHSRRSNWGTLTNTDLANVWKVDGGQYCYDNSGANFISTNQNLGNLTERQFTIAAWVYPRSVSSTGAIASDYSAAHRTTFQLEVGRTASRWSLLQNSGTVIYSTFTIAANQWSHLAISRSGSTSNWVLTLQKDGQVETVSTTANPDTNPTTVTIGKPSGVSIQYFSGLISDVTIWNRSLSANDLVSLYQLGRGGMYQRRRRRSRIYIPQAGFQAAWARRQSQIIGGGL